MWAENVSFFRMLSAGRRTTSKALEGLRPVFFGPHTLPWISCRTWWRCYTSCALLCGRQHTPDFLWNLVALTHFMLLSLTKAAHAALSNVAWQEIRVRGLVQCCVAG